MRSENETLSVKIIQDPAMDLWKQDLLRPPGYEELYFHAAIDYKLWVAVNLLLDLASALAATEGDHSESFPCQKARRVSL